MPGEPAPPPAATPHLPFDMPSTATLRASDRLVFAHYFTPYPVSLDNLPPSEDYYARNYLTPDGEGGIHRAYGGLLRDRPVPREPLPGDWELQDLESEVRVAAAAGIDGFTVDLLDLADGSAHRRRVERLVDAAERVDPGFRIVLMPDMSALTSIDAETLAAELTELAVSPVVHRLDDGRLVVSPFLAEQRTPTWWATFLAAMERRGQPVAFVPTFLDFANNAAAFAPISQGFSDWGNRSPAQQSGLAGNITRAHDLGKVWMQPVSVQDARPRSAVYDEAENTGNLRTTWQGAIDGGADWVQLVTWNDYSEGTQVAPSAHNGSAYLDLVSYYLTWFKTGERPTITRDVLYLTHRTHVAAARPTRGGQTVFMAARWNSSPPRDTVEVLAFLTAPGSVQATVGGRTSSREVPAGLAATTFPLAEGDVAAALVRGGEATATVVSPFRVVGDPLVQDLQYRAASSARGG